MKVGLLGSSHSGKIGLGVFLALVALLLVLFATPGQAQTDVNIKINFQNADGAVPDDYLKDFGQAYGEKTGANQGDSLSYGWIRQDSLDADQPTPLDLTKNGADRGRSGIEQRLDTIIHMQYADTGGTSRTTTPGAWEISVPDGTYDVTVSVGDELSGTKGYDSQHTINVEGESAINQFQSNAQNEYKQATATVEVTDGKLTMNAKGGTNTKPNYVEIVRTGDVAPEPPAVDESINFQSETAPVPDGYLRDFGQGYGERAGADQGTGLSYGWVEQNNQGQPTSLVGNGRDRNTNSDQRLDTLMHMQLPPESEGGVEKFGAWEMAVPNGTYEVTVAVGDPNNGTAPESHTTNVEGVKAVDGFPKSGAANGSGDRHKTATVTADVSDGKLTMDAIGGENTKINYVDILSKETGPDTTAPAAPDNAQARAGDSRVTVTWNFGTESDLAGYNVYAGSSATGPLLNGGTLLQNAYYIDRNLTNGTERTYVVEAVDESGNKAASDAVSATPQADATDDRPTISSLSPADGSTDVALSTGVSATLSLVAEGVDDETFTAQTVKLTEVGSGAAVPASRSTSGGNDTITLIPDGNLKANTEYKFEITDGVKDLNGVPFMPYEATFTTGTTDVFNPPGVTDGDIGDAAFDRVTQDVATGTGETFSSVTMGPDNRLYAGTVEGSIYRFPVDAQTGDLGTPEVINTVTKQENNYDCNTSTVSDNGCTSKRLIIGLTFEPGSTADNPKLWITHSTFGYRNMKDWGGKLSVLSGADLGQYRDVITNLPRSSKDHLTNSIEFKNDRIYIPVGATTAMGAYDQIWKGIERQLSAAVIEVDYNSIQGTLNAKTEGGGGNYDPYAPGAPVKVYASGVRNAVDLVWHSNGKLYAPTNGSAGGSNAPATPDNYQNLEQCQTRIDGKPYTGGPVEDFDGANNGTGSMKIDKTQDDYLFRVEKGGYYGNPNPTRCEWVLNGGNPTAGEGNDPGENPAYPAGTNPDPNWRGWAYDFKRNKSPNGVIEYKSNAFGGALKGKLIVARYTTGDIEVLHPTGPNGDIDKRNLDVPGFTRTEGSSNPLDLIEDTRNGNIYVTEGVTNPPTGVGKITLLKARESGSSPADITLDKSRLVTNAVNGATSAPQTVTVKNKGNSPLNVSGAEITGADANQFEISGQPSSYPVEIAPGESQEIGVSFAPTSTGPKGATLEVASDDEDTPVAKVNLRGLGTIGEGGSKEPSLQWILDTYEIPVNAGDPDKTNNSLPTDAILGEEIEAQSFKKAYSDAPVSVEPLAVFGPKGSQNVLGFGTYTTGDKASTQQAFTVPNGSSQALEPETNGELNLDPAGEFGFYSTWPAFNDREVFSENALNTWEPNENNRHKLRVYPMKGKNGTVEQNTYVVATEEHTSGYDYQDIVVVVRNVEPVEVAAPGADIEVQQSERVFSGVKNTTSDAQSVTVRNTGTAPLKITGAEITGPNAGAFKLAGSPSFPINVPADDSTTVDVQFAPGGSVGSLEAALSIVSDDPDEQSVDVGLYGLSANGEQGANEPTLQDVVNTLGHPTRVHDESGNPLTFGTGAELKGEEVAVPLFKKAGSGSVGIKPVARYSPDEKLPFGYYTLNAGSPQENVVATITTGQEQTLNPKTEAGGSDSFDPGSESFGIYVDSLSFGRKSYTQDGLNTGPTKHAARVYPAKNRAGDPMPNAYLVTYEDASNGDYQDYVFLVTNAKPATETSTGDTTKVNFQPDSAATPEGYTADSGQAYSASRGYGWVEPGTANPVDMTNNTRERGGSAEQRLKTLILINDSEQVRNGVPGVDGTWEMTVPDGTYDVKVSFGDADFYDSSHQVEIEGTLAPASPLTLSQAEPFGSATATAEVTDGRLTVANSGTNTKLNYVEITNQDTPPQIDTTDPTADVSIDGLKDGNGAYKNTATITIDAADEGGSGLVSTAYSLNDGEYKPYDGPVEVTEAGSYTIKARAVDGAGNTTTTDAQSFEVVIPPPSKAEIELENLDGVPFEDRLVFNRIQNPATPDQGVHDLATLRVQNTGVEPLNITKLNITPASDFELDKDMQLPATIAPDDHLDVPVRFVATSGDIRNGTLEIISDDADEPTTEVELSGFWQSRSEGGQEPNVAEISKVYGYGTTIVGPGQKLNNAGRVEAIGDEVLSPYWKRANGSEPVSVRQLAAFHTQGNTATAYWHSKGSDSTTQTVKHAGIDGQSFLPRKAGNLSQPASGTFNPGGTFGFKIDPEWSDPDKNRKGPDRTAGCDDSATGNDQCGHHVRFWPAEDRDGEPIANTYLMTMDYAGINYDYNDNVYLVENIRPENLAAPTNLAASPGDTRVELGWNSLVKSGDVGYNVYRSETEQVDTDGTPLNGDTPLTEASFTDEGLTNGTTYYYAVEAVDGSGSKSAASETVSATPVAPSSNTDFKINFQSAAAPVPSGYFRDYGQPYGARTGADQGNGMVYGWVEPSTQNPLDLSVGGNNNLGNGRDRNKNSDQRLDTLMHMQAGSAILASPFNGTAKDGTWEVSVPDGTYEVTVAAGDASVNSDPESHTINVEGENAIDNFVPSGGEGSDTRHGTATVDSVTVSDGKMTIGARGGDNSKIDYVEVKEATTVENQAPTVTQPEDQTNAEGDEVSLQVGAADPDDSDTLTYEATGLPAGLSIAPNTGEISGTIETGAAQQDPYTVEVTATDDGDPAESGTATFAWTVTAPQATGCPPYSELECGEVAVGLPYELNFDATTDLGGLADKNGVGTGFTMVQPSSNGGAYLPENLERGSLIVTTTAGIQYKTDNGTGPKENALDNGLGVGFDATKPVRIVTTIANPSAGTNKAEQGGIWFGPDEDNYVKLVVASAGSGNNKIQLLREINGSVDNATDEVNSAASKLSDKTVELILVADPTTNKVTASYTVDGGTEQKLDSFANIPASFFEGSMLDPQVNGVNSHAGIFATHRNATAANSPVQFAFEDFSVAAAPQPNEAPVADDDAYTTNEDTTLDVTADNGVLANDTDTEDDALTATLVQDTENGALTLNEDGSFIYEPDADFNGADTFTYKADVGSSSSETATVNITVDPVNDPPTVEAIDDLSVEAGQTATVDVTAGDPDGGDTVELSVKGPEFATLTDNGDGTGSIELAPGADAVGEQDVTVTAFDGTDSSSGRSFKVTVTEKPNGAPQLTRPENQSAAEGEEVSLQIKATDPDDGDTLTYEATGLPEGLSIDPDTGEVSGTIASGAAQNSPYTVEVTVSDGADSATESFQFEVTESADTEAPATPTGLKATPSQSGIALDWANNNEADLAGYNVYRSDNANGDFEKLNNAPINASEYDDTSALEGQFSYYRVTAVDEAGNESGFITDSAERPAPDTAPAAPNGLTATPSQDGISLAWDSNTENDLAGYNVYRSDSGKQGTYNKLNNQLLTDTGYNDSEAPTGELSYYRVTAVDEGGKESDPATDSAKRPEPPDTQAPEATIDSGPQGMVNKATAAFEFSANENGSTFECKLDDGSFENCTSPKEYTGLEDGEHTFTVRATDEADNISEPVSRTWKVDTETPAIPRSLTANGTINGIALNWDDNSEPDLAGYNIYRREAGGADFTKLNDDLLEDSKYDDADASAETTSYYRVMAVDKAGNESDFALESAYRPVPDTEAPATPRSLTATPSQSGIALDWADNSEEDLAGYNVSRREAGEADFVKLNSDPLEDSRYDDTAASAGKTSYYRVTAVDKAGNESNFAADSASRPERPQDTTAPNTSITGGPSGFTRSRNARFVFNADENGSTFECRLDGGPVEGCTSAKVYRNLSDGRHVFWVRATDEAGNIDRSVAKRVWTVDTRGPRVYKVSPTRVTRDRTPVVRATINDARVNLAKSDIKLYFDGRQKGRFSYNRRTDQLTYRPGRVANKLHTVKIVAVDKAGNRTVKVWRFRVR